MKYGTLLSPLGQNRSRYNVMKHMGSPPPRYCSALRVQLSVGRKGAGNHFLNGIKMVIVLLVEYVYMPSAQDANHRQCRCTQADTLTRLRDAIKTLRTGVLLLHPRQEPVDTSRVTVAGLIRINSSTHPAWSPSQ